MKIFATYWLVGCVFVGFAVGDYKDRCPDDELKTGEILAAVAAWPALIVGAIARSRAGEPHCRR